MLEIICDSLRDAFPHMEICDGEMHNFACNFSNKFVYEEIPGFDD